MTEQSSAPAPDGLQRGQVYKIKHQVGEISTPCIAMSEETWVDFGTHMESFRAIARKQDAQLKETKNLLAVAQRQLGETLEKLNNLRAIRKAEKRPEVEAAVHKLLNSEGTDS